MKITVPATAAQSGVLRILLRRIPVWSEVVYAFRLGPDGAPASEVARAHVYGRGEGSDATERVTLQFRFRVAEGEEPPYAGETLLLCVALGEAGRYVPLDHDLDVLEVG